MRKLFIILLAFFFGCESPSEKLINENKLLLDDNQSLKKRHKSISEINFKLQQENEHLRKLIPILEFSSKSIVSDTLIETIYYNLVYEDSDLTNTTEYQFLYSLSELANPNRNNGQLWLNTENLIKAPRFEDYLHYLWRTIDRSPGNIKYHFDKNKNIAYKLLKHGNSYESSGLKNTLKSLLLSYDEIGKQKKLLNELYKRTDSIGVLSDTIYQSIESGEMTKLISEFRDSDFVSYSQWTYSFWARRNQEKNAETVYQIINEFYNEMSTYEFIEELEEEDYNAEGF